MKSFYTVLSTTIFTLLLSSCSPFTKDSYFKRFGSFMEKVAEEHAAYTDEDWEKADKRFEQLSNTWYEKFSGDMTISEKLRVQKYRVRYKYFKWSKSFRESWDEFISNDAGEIQEYIQYYISNDMEEDLRELVEAAEEEGGKAMEKLKQVFRDLDLNWDDYTGE